MNFIIKKSHIKVTFGLHRHTNIKMLSQMTSIGPYYENIKSNCLHRHTLWKYKVINALYRRSTQSLMAKQCLWNPDKLSNPVAQWVSAPQGRATSLRLPNHHIVALMRVNPRVLSHPISLGILQKLHLYHKIVKTLLCEAPNSSCTKW